MAACYPIAGRDFLFALTCGRLLCFHVGSLARSQRVSRGSSGVVARPASPKFQQASRIDASRLVVCRLFSCCSSRHSRPGSTTPTPKLTPTRTPTPTFGSPRPHRLLRRPGRPPAGLGPELAGLGTDMSARARQAIDVIPARVDTLAQYVTACLASSPVSLRWCAQASYEPRSTRYGNPPTLPTRQEHEGAAHDADDTQLPRGSWRVRCLRRATRAVTCMTEWTPAELFCAVNG
jgi:hypothetical protein